MSAGTSAGAAEALAPGRIRRRIDALFPLSLRAALILGFSLVLGLFVLVGVFAVISERTTIRDFNRLLAVDIRTAELGQKSVSAMMKARRYEKDFLLMFREFGFAEAKSRYLTLLQANLADTRESLAEMGALDASPETARHIARATQAINSYENSFLSVVALYGQLGFIDAGLEGEFREAAHRIEALLDGPGQRELSISLLTMRRYEKDYLVRRRAVDSAQVQAALMQFEKNLASAAIPGEIRPQLAGLASLYGLRFQKYVDTNRQIDVEVQRYLAAVQAIEPDLEKLLSSARAQSETMGNAIRRKAQHTETMVEVVGLAGIVLGVLVAWLVAHRITRLIHQSRQFAERIAAGDLRTRTTPTGGDEFSVLGRSLNHMANALQEANSNLEQRVGQLRRAEEKLSGVLDTIPMVVWSLSAGHELLYLNPAVHAIYGRSVAEFAADPTLWTGIVHPDDRAGVTQWLAQVLTVNALTLQYRIVRPDGEVRWLEDRARTVHDAHGSLLRLDGVATDISERRLRDERIQHLANFDALTGVPNRNLLMNLLELALIQARRSRHRLGLLFLDMDRFKYFNDTFGHSFGDSLLKEFAARLKSVLREGDIVARLGGDEFVIILADLQEPENAARLALDVLDAVSRAMTVDGRELHVSASIGVSVYPEDGDEAGTLLKHADVAMYRAKEKGRNCFQSYTLEMGSTAMERVQLEHALRHAMENDEFELHYQPQVDLQSGRVTSVEALIRWRHPELGFVAPARFIPVAEETGLIISIGLWVLKAACVQARAWHQDGYPLHMAVNVSGRQLQHMPQLVRSVLDETGLDAAYLELELTESMLMNDSEATIKILGHLKAIGVRLSIDDFGTGFSSLSYLTRFPIDIIKIDQSFISGLAEKPESASITIAVIALAKALGLNTVAEGVETAQQLEFLYANGCDAMQGYYFSRPVPADDLRALLERGRQLQAGKICDAGASGGLALNAIGAPA